MIEKVDDPVAQAYLEILDIGISDARNALASGNHKVAFAIMQHIHNAPKLVAQKRVDSHRYYIENFVVNLEKDAVAIDDEILGSFISYCRPRWSIIRDYVERGSPKI